MKKCQLMLIVDHHFRTVSWDGKDVSSVSELSADWSVQLSVRRAPASAGAPSLAPMTEDKKIRRGLTLIHFIRFAEMVST